MHLFHHSFSRGSQGFVGYSIGVGITRHKNILLVFLFIYLEYTIILQCHLFRIYIYFAVLFIYLGYTTVYGDIHLF